MLISTNRRGAAAGPETAPPLPPHASAGKRWRFRRNAVIYVAHRNGLSQRLLADVFDLPRSRIAAIVKEFQTHGAVRDSLNE